MIRFNALLTQAGIDPKEVKLVRHQDNRTPDGPTPYQLWRAGDGRLELYRQIQSSTVFSGASFIAVFVVSDFGETVFVGIYRVNGVGKAESGLLDPISDPISGEDCRGFTSGGRTPTRSPDHGIPT